MRHIVQPKHKVVKNSKLDNLALIVGVVQPLTTVPQIILVYANRDASGVSFFMWTAYNVASIVLLMYGLRHRLPPVIWAQALWLVVQTPMMLSVFIF